MDEICQKYAGAGPFPGASGAFAAPTIDSRRASSGSSVCSGSALDLYERMNSGEQTNATKKSEEDLDQEKDAIWAELNSLGLSTKKKKKKKQPKKDPTKIDNWMPNKTDAEPSAEPKESLDDRRRAELKAIMKDKSLQSEERRVRMDEVKKKYAALAKKEEKMKKEQMSSMASINSSGSGGAGVKSLKTNQTKKMGEGE